MNNNTLEQIFSLVAMGLLDPYEIFSPETRKAYDAWLAMKERETLIAAGEVA